MPASRAASERPWAGARPRSVRAPDAGSICLSNSPDRLANMRRGGDRRSDQTANLRNDQVSTADAAKMLGVGTDPLAFVISLNLTRRHLTESQRASAAARLANMRREDTLVQNRSANLPNGKVAVSNSDAASMLGVFELIGSFRCCGHQNPAPPLRRGHRRHRPAPDRAEGQPAARRVPALDRG